MCQVAGLHCSQTARTIMIVAGTSLPGCRTTVSMRCWEGVRTLWPTVGYHGPEPEGSCASVVCGEASTVQHSGQTGALYVMNWCVLFHHVRVFVIVRMAKRVVRWRPHRPRWCALYHSPIGDSLTKKIRLSPCCSLMVEVTLSALVEAWGSLVDLVAAPASNLSTPNEQNSGRTVLDAMS